MFDPKDEALVLRMYQFAYPKLSDSSLIQLMDLEFSDFLSRIAVLKMAADNGFDPEAMVIVKEKFNAKAEEVWALVMSEGNKDD